MSVEAPHDSWIVSVSVGVADPLAQVTYNTSLGPHVITIKPTGFKNGSSSFTWTYIDGYTVGGVKYEE